MEILPDGDDTSNYEINVTETTQSEQALKHEREKEAADPGSASNRYKFQFKLIDFGLANFEETYACGPDLLVAEVCIGFRRYSLACCWGMQYARLWSCEPSTMLWQGIIDAAVLCLACGSSTFRSLRLGVGVQREGGDEMQVQTSAPSVAMGPGCALPIMLQRDDVDRLPSTSPIEKLYRYMWRRKV
ncbi:hypothetical protein MMC29_000030 [Sticta canariensis]|nr:hypothetical protein [Sticta canariensis]